MKYSIDHNNWISITTIHIFIFFCTNVNRNVIYLGVLIQRGAA